MKAANIAASMVIMVLLTACVAGAAYLESDSKSDGGHFTPSNRIIPPGPDPANAVRSLLRQVDVGRPTRYGHLWLYPLQMRSSRSQGIRTMDESLDRGWLSIREKERANVSELLVRNESAQPIFLMTGETIAGGKQNRIVAQDVLLSANSDFVSVPVYCGEQDRWTGKSALFSSGRSLADHSLRSMAARGESQDAIWGKIDGNLARAGVKSRTRSYQELYQDRKLRREMEQCIARFRHLCGRRTIGVVAVVNFRIVGCDVFSDPRVMSAFWDKICRSYAFDVVVAAKHGSGIFQSKRRLHVMPDAAIRRFLANAIAGTYRPIPTPGAGQAWRIAGRVPGSALVWRGQAVHINLEGCRVGILPLCG